MIALYEELGSYRAVASILGCDHKTVKRYVELAGDQGQLAPIAQRARLTDPHLELIRARIEKTKAKITARRLQRELRAVGYAGSERSLRRAVATEKDAYRRRVAAEGRIFRPWVSGPGEWLLCDWGSAGKVASARWLDVPLDNSSVTPSDESGPRSPAEPHTDRTGMGPMEFVDPLFAMGP